MAHFYPGLGDPFGMSLRMFNAMLERIEDVIDWQNIKPREAIFRYADRLRKSDPERYWNP